MAESGILTVSSSAFHFNVFCLSVLHGFLLLLIFIMPYTTNLEKAMALHSSTPAWKIPWIEEPSRLQSMGLLRVGHD